MTKKRKISGLSGIELFQAHESLVKLKQSLVITEEDDGQDTEQSEDFARGLDELMESRLNGPQV